MIAQRGKARKAVLAGLADYFSGGLADRGSYSAFRRASSRSAAVEGFFGGAAPVMMKDLPKDVVPHVGWLPLKGVIFLEASGATRIKPSPATGQETPRCLGRDNRSMRGT